jgi:predicted anti-sigma-YlaC factor YlaD
MFMLFQMRMAKIVKLLEAEKKFWRAAQVFGKACVYRPKFFNMDCQKIQQQLVFHFYHELSEKETIETEQHLSHCSECRQQYSLIEKSLARIPGMKQQIPNPYLFTRIEAALSQDSPIERQTRPSMIRVISSLVVSLLLATTAIMSYYILSNQSTEPAPKPGENVKTVAGQYEMGMSQADIMETYYLSE